MAMHCRALCSPDAELRMLASRCRRRYGADVSQNHKLQHIIVCHIAHLLSLTPRTSNLITPRAMITCHARQGIMSRYHNEMRSNVTKLSRYSSPPGCVLFFFSVGNLGEVRRSENVGQLLACACRGEFAPKADHSFHTRLVT